MRQSEVISLRGRIWLWIVAWGVAAIACMIPNPRIIVFAWLFPFGLFSSFVHTESMGEVNAVSIFGWVLYITLTFFGLRQSRRVRYFLVYTILCVILILNVVGCHVAPLSTKT